MKDWRVRLRIVANFSEESGQYSFLFYGNEVDGDDCDLLLYDSNSLIEILLLGLKQFFRQKHDWNVVDNTLCSK